MTAVSGDKHCVTICGVFIDSGCDVMSFFFFPGKLAEEERSLVFPRTASDVPFGRGSHSTPGICYKLAPRWRCPEPILIRADPGVFFNGSVSG